MNEGLIPNRYAKALYAYANEAGKAAEVYDATLRLSRTFEAEARLARAVENPFLPFDDKRSLLLVAAGAVKNGCIDKFFGLVFSHRRESLLHEMALAYGKKYRSENNIAQVEIATAAALPAAAMKKIKDSVQSHLKGHNLDYTERVDASLIGGFTVKVNGEVLDASVRNDIRKLRLKLLSNK